LGEKSFKKEINYWTLLQGVIMGQYGALLRAWLSFGTTVNWHQCNFDFDFASYLLF
jgi:hypothetical protein